MILNENVDRKIISIAGGKGGVGKSVLAANLALSMAMYEKRVVLVDLDLGGSNLHTMLGLRNINPGIGNFVSKRKSSFRNLLYETEYDNLSFVPGDVLVYGLGELTKSTKSKIIKGLLEIDADYIVIDLGAGTNFTVVDFFLVSNSGLIITTPQAISVMNAYSFLKNFVFRFLQRAFAPDRQISTYLRKVRKERRIGERHSINQIISSISQMNPAAGEKGEAFLEVLQPKLILNRVKNVEDIGMAEGLRDLCAQNLSIELECLGTIMEDERINRSIDLQKPFILDNSEGVTTGEIHRISQKIIQSSNFPEMPLELDYYADSFELAHIETENDVNALQERGGNESVRQDMDKLMELIRIQQERIRELQGTLRKLSINQG